jgi:hypothetical protein
MKIKKEIHIKLDENLFIKISSLAKENNLSLTQVITSLIEKGFVKKSNDYKELIDFFAKNFVEKKHKETFELNRKIDELNNNFSELIKILLTPATIAQPTPKLTAADMAKDNKKLTADEMKKLDDEFWGKS